MASAGSGKKKSELEVVSVELPAPEGWVKKFIPKQGGTPRRNEVVFISPTGEEIKNRRQLDQFLRSHPGGPPSSSFDWGTGDTPRRSARISEKVQVLPEVEKPKRASRSSEKLKSLPEVEKNKLDSSSGLQKGTKRNKNSEYSGDEAEGEADEGDGSKCGDKEDAKGLKKVKRRKKTTEDKGHKALGESPKDVDMEVAKGTKLTKPVAAATIEEIHNLVDNDLTVKTKGNVEEVVEQPIESEIANEQDVEFLEGRGKDFKEALDDTEVSPTAATDSEKVALIEKNDTPKDVDMEVESSMHNNAKNETTSEVSHGLVENESTDKTDENVEENAEQPIEAPGEFKHELADKARENDDMEEAKGTVNNKSKEAAGEGVFGLVEPELYDKTEINALENVELPAQSHCAIKHEFAVRIEENVEESVEIKHKLAHQTIDNVKQNVEDNQDLEQLEGKETELEPVLQVKEDKLSITDVSSDSDKVALIHLDHQAPAKKDEDAKTSGNGGNKEKEVKTAQKNKFEHGKEIKENTIDAKAFQAASDSEKVFFIEQHVGVSAEKIDEASVCINKEASVCINKEASTLSENGGKGQEEEIAALDDFIQDYDDGNMRIEPSSSNW